MLVQYERNKTPYAVSCDKQNMLSHRGGMTIFSSVSSASAKALSFLGVRSTREEKTGRR
jgi:hypothetical protein